ncbi:hypothetical protein RM190_08065 [Paracoccus sp. CPCC 101403]|uniref:Uncharacterized protein n=2 Tax=Paracoccus broussonetiae TaxID=3075834 RepID=A0ABU3EC54_9RHOB|nr:hypothetical protein [Paracoccus sp. CPCC 101403]MDT1061808.1 hypothetical protein [Paracoccus sp. CPCC 101403]
MDAYPHLKILISLILGLAITRVLSGLSRRVQQPAWTEGMFSQIVWSLVLLLGAVHFWWWEFALRRVDTWHFGAYVFVLSYASLHFLMATLLYPDALPDHAESERFFMRRRGLFFGLFGLSFAFDLGDTLLKGTAHLQGLGPEYPIRLGLGVLAAILALRARSSRAVGLIGLAWLVYDLSWIIRRYDGLD